MKLLSIVLCSYSQRITFTKLLLTSLLLGTASATLAEPSANGEHLQLFSATQPLKFHSDESKMSKRFKRIFGSVHFAFDDLRHPVSLLRSAKNRLRWNMPTLNEPTMSFARVDSQAAIDSALSARLFDVTLSHAPTYRLNSNRTQLAGTRVLVTNYADPKTAVVQTSLPYRVTATQLQVRMRNEVSLLWEVERSTSVVQGDELGLGLGLRYSF